MPSEAKRKDDHIKSNSPLGSTSMICRIIPPVISVFLHKGEK